MSHNNMHHCCQLLIWLLLLTNRILTTVEKHLAYKASSALLMQLVTVVKQYTSVGEQLAKRVTQLAGRTAGHVAWHAAR